MAVSGTGRSNPRSVTPSSTSGQRTSATASTPVTRAAARATGHSGQSTFTAQAPARSLFAQKLGPYPHASDEVNAAILNASRRTGMDYTALMAIAAQESAFRPHATATTSTATGLYQFLNQTWLEQMKQHGARHGYGELADQISWDKKSKSYVVADAGVKKEILDLRLDPTANALMGAEYSLGNQKYLEKQLGRSVNPTEVYMAHFLGRGGAAQFLAARAEGKGGDSAAAAFPAAAKANRSIFYDAKGNARSLDQVFDVMKNKIAPKVDNYQPPRGQYTYEPGRTPNPGPNMFDSAFNPPTRGGSFGFGPHGTPTGGGNSRFDSVFNPPVAPPGSRFGFGDFGIPVGTSNYRASSLGHLGVGTLGAHGLNSFTLSGWSMPRSGFDRNGIGTIGGSNSFGSSSGGLSGLGIGSIGSPGQSFGLYGGIGSGPTYGRAGGWQFGVGFDFSKNRVTAPTFSIGGGVSTGSSYGVGGVGGTSFGGAAFGLNGAASLGGGGVRGGSSSSYGSFGGTSYGGSSFSSFGSSPIGGGSWSGGGSSSSFNGSGK